MLNYHILLKPWDYVQTWGRGSCNGEGKTGNRYITIKVYLYNSDRPLTKCMHSLMTVEKYHNEMRQICCTLDTGHICFKRY